MNIFFEKLANFDRIMDYSKVSIPFKKGYIFDDKLINIVDKDGIFLNVQTEILTKWEDGSIKWVLTHFLKDLPKNDKANFTITTKKHRDEKELIDVDCMLKNSVPLYFSINIDGEKHSLDLDLSALNESDYKIVRHGSVILEIETSADFIISEGQTFRIIFNIEFYKGKTYAKVDIKFINLGMKDLDLSDAYITYKSDEKFDNAYIGYSNYGTEYIELGDKEEIYDKIDAKRLMLSGNEHFPEVFFGAYYGVLKVNNKCVAITIKEAFQNYPKAFDIRENMLCAYLIPEDEVIAFKSGMAKTHTIFVHNAEGLSKDEINNQHHQFQMCDLPILDSKIYEDTNMYEDVFTKDEDDEVEEFFVNMADAKGCTFGMLNYGDVYDKGYTGQGRGQSHLVFANNEYDYPYNAFLIFIRNGNRRFFDYFSASARHMIDIDICHYSDDIYRLGGLIEHSRLHTTGNVMLSHEWVKGLIEYYHMTGDYFAKKCFLGIGENILRNLRLPFYNSGFLSNARESGWALCALVALYEETFDDRYLKACDDIVVHFVKWQEVYGTFLAPYTAHTTIRVPFMISVACNSLYSYYRINKSEVIKKLILTATDDLIENALLKNGLFYYKELPSLQRNGNNVIILETLSICYNLTGDKKYLEAGKKTFNKAISKEFSSSSKDFIDNVVLMQGTGTKLFAQSYYPLLKYYNVCVSEGVLWKK